jgi:hypothetical protein
MQKKLLALAVVLGLAISLHAVRAEETTTTTATEPTTVTESTAVTADETVTASDLGVAEPTLLPDSRFYFFKNWGRAIRETLTFNKEKRAELATKFASERLIEAQKLAEKAADPAVLNKAVENYQTEIEKIKALSDQVNKDDPNAGKFLDKLADFQLKHQRAIDRLSKQLPPEAKERALAAQEKSLEQFGEMMVRLDDPEKMKERLEKALGEQKGGEFKNFKNLEVLMRIEAKAPDAAKAALRGAQENALNRLHGDLNQMSPADQAKFKDYLGGVGGNELRQAEIIDRLENKGLPEGMKKEMEASRADIAGRMEKRMENMSEADRTKLQEKIEKGELPRPKMMNDLEKRLPPAETGINRIDSTPARQTQQSSFGERIRPPLPPQTGTGIKPLPGQSLPGQINPTVKPPLPPPLPGQTAPTPIR